MGLEGDVVDAVGSLFSLPGDVVGGAGGGGAFEVGEAFMRAQIESTSIVAAED